MTTETITVAGDNVSIDLLVWRRYRRPMPGIVEQVLDINPGLAALGPILPAGTVVKMPVVRKEPARISVVRLWN